MPRSIAAMPRSSSSRGLRLVDREARRKALGGLRAQGVLTILPALLGRPGPPKRRSQGAPPLTPRRPTHDQETLAEGTPGLRSAPQEPARDAHGGHRQARAGSLGGARRSA